jgi:hypothetical protein
MEAWLIADVEVLQKFYGQGFNANPIPKTLNVEHISKQTIESALKSATRRTAKGEYHKIKHGAKLLRQLNASKVRAAAFHCDRLFTTLAEKLSATI